REARRLATAPLRAGRVESELRLRRRARAAESLSREHREVGRGAGHRAGRVVPQLQVVTSSTAGPILLAMPKGSSKRGKREDSSQAARRVVDTVIERSEADAEPEIEITPEMR